MRDSKVHRMGSTIRNHHTGVTARRQILAKVSRDILHSITVASSRVHRLTVLLHPDSANQPTVVCDQDCQQLLANLLSLPPKIARPAARHLQNLATLNLYQDVIERPAASVAAGEIRTLERQEVTTERRNRRGCNNYTKDDHHWRG